MQLKFCWSTVACGSQRVAAAAASRFLDELQSKHHVFLAFFPVSLQDLNTWCWRRLSHSGPSAKTTNWLQIVISAPFCSAVVDQECFHLNSEGFQMLQQDRLTGFLLLTCSGFSAEASCLGGSWCLQPGWGGLCFSPGGLEVEDFSPSMHQTRKVLHTEMLDVSAPVEVWLCGVVKGCCCLTDCQLLWPEQSAGWGLFFLSWRDWC